MYLQGATQHNTIGTNATKFQGKSFDKTLSMSHIYESDWCVSTKDLIS